MASDIREWLEKLELGKYGDVFVENEITQDEITDLNDDDLKELGLPMGPRKRLLRAIAQSVDNDDTGAPKQASTAAERRQLTVMFCDLVGSTALSRQLDPEDLRDVMRRYQDAVAGCIARYGGHVAKFLDDGVLAYFGWPQAYEDQAERAVRAGLDAVTAIRALTFDDDLALDARVSISTGEVVVGDLVGEQGRDAEAVTGETPNLAARLQGLAEPGQVLVGPDTRRLIGESFDLIDHGARQLKGFDTPVPAWQVVGEATVDSRFEASHGLGLTRFVGREAERQLLFERWGLAKGGEGQTILLSGEAGIGKSRMVQAIREHVAGRAHYRLRYQCSPYHGNSAFYPVIQRLERAAGFSNDDDSGAKLDKLEALLAMSGENIDAVAPYFAILLSLPWEERYGAREITPQQIRDRTIEALIGQALTLSRQRPVLFVLEDAHWIDPSTEALFREIIARTADASIFIVITYRPEYEPPWPKQPHLTSIALNRLSRVQGAEIVRAVGGDKLPEALIDGIVARADGVPLYVEEIAKSVLETDRSDSDRDTDAIVPDSLQASLSARLDRLGEAKKVAQIAAVIGREFPFKLIFAVYDDASLGQMLDQLVASEMVYRIRAEPEPVYLFKHALVQNAAYGGLLRADRRAAHAGIAEALQVIYSEQVAASPELLALHFTEAGLTDQALDYWLKAGLRANGQSAYLEAIGHLRKGLSALAVCRVCDNPTPA